ncbi:hypothetical protein [Hyphomonas sp.]|uniref:hypothetical protein n=1 Tax=Hyphomonas sp. TaxID=87 RepID=UPI003529C464
MKTAIEYGVAAFCIGFAFGTLRQMLLIPLFGEPWGHWIEFPLVTGSVCMVGFWLGRGTESRSASIVAGIGGVVLLLMIESAFALGLLRQDLATYLASFDIGRGALFPYGLVMMLLAPIHGWRQP